MNILVIGYYGVRNIGDDLMLLGLLKKFNRHYSIKNIFVIVHENYYHNFFDFLNMKLDLKVKFINGEKFLFTKIRKLIALLKADVIVWGGGTCFYEDDNIDGLKGLNKLVNLSWFLKKPFVFLDIGIGNLHSEFAINIVKKISRKSSLVIFREEQSQNLCTELMLSNKKRCIGGDLSFLLFDELKHFAINSNEARRSINKIAFCGHYSFYNNSHITKLYAKCLNECCKDLNAHLVFIPFKQGADGDNMFHQEISKFLNIDFEIQSYKSPLIFSILREVDFLIGIRLHSIIVADLLNIPRLPISYSPKIKFYVKRTTPKQKVFDVGEKFTTQDIKSIYNKYDSLEVIKFSERECRNAEFSLKLMFSNLGFQ